MDKAINTVFLASMGLVIASLGVGCWSMFQNGEPGYIAWGLLFVACFGVGLNFVLLIIGIWLS